MLFTFTGGFSGVIVTVGPVGVLVGLIVGVLVGLWVGEAVGVLLGESVGRSVFALALSAGL